MTAPKMTLTDDEKSFAEFDFPTDATFFREKPTIKDESFLEKARKKTQSVSAAGLKGLFQGVQTLGKSLGPLLPETKEDVQAEQNLSSLIEEALPSEEGILESGAERFGKLFPTVATGGGGFRNSLMRSAFGATSGQAAEELGFGETGQTVAELLALITPSEPFSFRPQIRPTRQQKPIVDFLRNQGMTEQQIAPILQDVESRSFGPRATLSPRRGRVARRLESTQEALGNVFDNLRQRPEAVESLAPEARTTLQNGLLEVMDDLPREVRNSILGDFQDLMASEFTGSDIINFFRDINQQLPKTNKRQLGRLKEPIIEALQAINPQFAQDFQMANEAFSRFAGVRNQLRPNLVGDIASAIRNVSKIPQAMLGIYLGMPGLIGEMALESGLRQLAAESLTNPRFVNLGNQFVAAINRQSPRLVQSVANETAKFLDDTDPELAEQFRNIDAQGFINELKALEEDQ